MIKCAKYVLPGGHHGNSNAAEYLAARALHWEWATIWWTLRPYVPEIRRRSKTLREI